MLITSQERAVLRRAINNYGSVAQIDMVQEECGELVAAINRWKRGRDEGAEQVAEELADVLLCCIQASMILGEIHVRGKMREKLDRLRARLDEEEARR